MQTYLLVLDENGLLRNYVCNHRSHVVVGRGSGVVVVGVLHCVLLVMEGWLVSGAILCEESRGGIPCLLQFCWRGPWQNGSFQHPRGTAHKTQWLVRTRFQCGLFSLQHTTWFLTAFAGTGRLTAFGFCETMSATTESMSSSSRSATEVSSSSSSSSVSLAFCFTGG
jgi:hypothetical protein